ncbi:MAG: cysteine dioxygenase family protein [candidate division WOR-3 bacterium]
MTRRVSINELIAGLSRAFAQEFSQEQVAQYLIENPVEVASLAPYIRFGERTYTRNLIYQDSNFGAVLLCWEPGQHSPVHRHVGQWGWVTVVQGQLVITTFIKLRSEIIESEEPDVNWSRVNSIFLKQNHCYTVSAGDVFLEVSPPETIHKADNPASLRQQSISLHICTRPSDTSVIYDVENHRCRTVRMGYV